MSDSPTNSSSDHGLPRLDRGHRRARLLATRPEGLDSARLDLEVDGPWSHRAGQVAELALVPGEEGFFAIASPPGDGRRLTFLVRAGGSISAPLMALRPGDELFVRGPHGRGYELDSPARSAPLLLVGVGSALSALRSALLDTLGAGSRPITLVLGVRTRDDLAFADELGFWRSRGVSVHLVESRATPGTMSDTGNSDPASPACEMSADPGSALASIRPGHVQDHLGPIASALPGALVLLAGSESFEDEVTAILTAAGIEPTRIQRNFRNDGREDGRNDDRSTSQPGAQA